MEMPIRFRYKASRIANNPAATAEVAAERKVRAAGKDAAAREREVRTAARGSVGVVRGNKKAAGAEGSRRPDCSHRLRVLRTR